MQVKFLAYHSEAITGSQRAAVWVDAATVLWFWPLIASRRGAWWRGFVPERWRDAEGRRLGTSPWLATWLTLPALLFTVGFATVALVPGLRYETQRQEDGSEKLIRHLDGFEGRLVRWLNRTLPEPTRCSLLVPGAPGLPAEPADRDSTLPAACAHQLPGAPAELGPTLRPTAWLFDPHRDADGNEIGAEAQPLLARLLPDRYLDLRGEILLAKEPSPEVLHALRGDLDRLPGEPRRNEDEPAPAAGPTTDAPEQPNSLKAWLVQTVPLARLEGRDLQGANLAGAVLPLADLDGTRLAGADLERAQLQGANLFEAQLQGADLGQAQLQGANLGAAQLQGANLGWAQLQGANLGGAVLDAADLGGAALAGVSGNVEAEGAVFRDVSDRPLDDADVERLRQAVAPYLDAEELQAVTERLAAARQAGFGTFRIVKGECFGPAAIGCRGRDGDFEAFRTDKHLPARVRLACADADAARGLVERLVGDPNRADFGLAQSLAARLGDAGCAGLKALSDAERERLDQAVAAEREAQQDRPQR